MEKLKAVYLDLDGTLLGKGGQLLRSHSGGVTHAGTKALALCLNRGVEVVFTSGRTRVQLWELMRAFGQRSCVFEVGSGLTIDGDQGEPHWLGAQLPGEGTRWERILDSGAPRLLLERFAGRLSPFHPEVPRQVSHLFNGWIDRDEANAFLIESGHSNLTVIDNGLVSLGQSGKQSRSYHLVPAGASKAAAVKLHMELSEYHPAECISIGDSVADLEVGEVVGQGWLVQNALEDPEVQALRHKHGVRFTRATAGAGVLEVLTRRLG